MGNGSETSERLEKETMNELDPIASILEMARLALRTRKAIGVRQSEIAKLMHRTQSAISQLEHKLELNFTLKTLQSYINAVKTSSEKIAKDFVI
jgi:transcriptional regulator with XRE-family HTH domain